MPIEYYFSNSYGHMCQTKNFIFIELSHLILTTLGDWSFILSPLYRRAIVA